MIQYFSIITTITGIFTILDLFIVKEAKNKVAEYVFGFGEANLATFESQVVTALISPFKTGNRLSYAKTLFRYSLLIFTFSLISILMYGYFNDVEMREILQNAASAWWRSTKLFSTVLIIGSILCWPFDFWSLWVTNKLFIENRSSSLFGFVWRILADIILTILPLAIVFGLIHYLFQDASVSTVGGRIFVMGFIIVGANMVGALMITILQLATLFIGIFTRVVLRATRFNQRIAMVSRANEFPFTFIGLLCGSVVAIYSGISQV